MADQLDWLNNEPENSKFQIHHGDITKMLIARRQDGKGPLHGYQVEAVLKASGMLLKDEGDMRDHQKVETKPVVIVAPTGAGKSGVILLLPYAIKSSKVLIITPSRVISDQLAIAFGAYSEQKSFLEEIGMVPNTKEGKIRLKKLMESVKLINGPDDLQENLPNVVIVNAQKFSGRSRMSLMYRNEPIIQNVESFFAQFDTLIVDEAHHYPAPTWVKIVEEFGKPAAGVFKKIIFVTATPYKMIRNREQFILGTGKENRIAYKVTQEMVLGVSTRPCEFVEKGHDGSPENVYKDIMELFKKNKKREHRFVSQVMILVSRRQQANDLVNFLNHKSRKPDFAIAALGGQPQALKQFSEGQSRVVVSCGIGKEGYNNTNVTICVILRKTQSKILFSQFVGRCMRLRRGLQGSDPDRSTATVLSYKQFEQRKLWEARERLAEEDPVDEDSDEE